MLGKQETELDSSHRLNEITCTNCIGLAPVPDMEINWAFKEGQFVIVGCAAWSDLQQEVE